MYEMGKALTQTIAVPSVHNDFEVRINKVSASSNRNSSSVKGMEHVQIDVVRSLAGAPNPGN